MIEKYITSLEKLSNPAFQSRSDLNAWKSKTINLITRIYGNNSKQEEQVNGIEFKNYPSSTFAGVTAGGGNNAASCEKEASELISGFISDIQEFGLPDKLVDNDSGNDKINIALTQYQNQTVNINIIWESIEDELTGKQVKELRKIIEGKGNKDEKKKKVLEKLSDFGANVASNVLSSILTNPAILSAFG